MTSPTPAQSDAAATPVDPNFTEWADRQRLVNDERTIAYAAWIVAAEQAEQSYAECKRLLESEHDAHMDCHRKLEQAEQSVTRLKQELGEAREWIPVSERLPELEQVVLLSIPSGYDGQPVYYWGARVDDSEGWLWGVQTSSMGLHVKSNSAFNDIEADDDYQPTHWMPIPEPPAAIAQSQEP